MELISLLVPLAAFGTLYVYLHRRAKRGAGRYPVRWGWIAAIVACAAVAFAIGALDL
jgi:uncharacterized membrane protein